MEVRSGPAPLPSPRRRRAPAPGVSSAAPPRPVDGTSLAVVRIAFGLVGVLVVVRTARQRVGRVALRRAAPPLHLRRVRLGRHRRRRSGTYAAGRRRSASPRCSSRSGWHTALALVVFLVGVRLARAHRGHDVPQPLLVRHAPRDRAPRRAVAARVLVARRAARRGRATGAARRGLARARAGRRSSTCSRASPSSTPTGSLHGLPLRMWLPARSDLAIVGPWLDEPWVALGLSWAGAAFDLLIVPALCWRRTRPSAWCAIVVFHVVTWRLFPIGVFPWLMIAVSTVFFAPDWPRTSARTLWRRPRPRPTTSIPCADPGRRRPVACRGSSWSARSCGSRSRCCSRCGTGSCPATTAGRTRATASRGSCCSPRRAATSRFRVARARDRPPLDRDRAGPLHAEPVAGDDDRTRVDPSGRARRSPNDRPTAAATVEVRADAFVALNGRPAQRLVDPRVDLAREPWRIHQPWILPAPTSSPS